jgi:serine/threonine protein kinase
MVGTPRKRNRNNNTNNANTNKKPEVESPEFVAEGTYGCVMAPALSCDRNENLNTSSVSKLFSANSSGSGMKEAQDEHAFNRIIAKIDPDRKFTLKTGTACKVNSARINPTELRKCSMYSNLTSRKELPMLVIENGGVTMTDLINQNGLVHLKKQNPDVLMAGMWRLFYGIKVLAEHRLIHQDIKNDNILISDEKVAFIDFGIMSNHWNNHYKYTVREFLSSPYEIFPPEYNFMEVAYLLGSGSDIKTVEHSSFTRVFDIMANMHTKITSPSIKEFVERYLLQWYKEYKKQSRRMHVEFYSKISSSFRRPSKRCVIADKKCDIIPSVFQVAKYFDQHVNKIDVYSLGIVMMKLVFTCAIANTVTLAWITVWLNDIIRPMVHPDPEKRCDAAEASRNFAKISKPFIRITNSNAKVQQAGR